MSGRLTGLLIRLAARLVPAPAREEWRREWLAEIESVGAAGAAGTPGRSRGGGHTGGEGHTGGGGHAGGSGQTRGGRCAAGRARLAWAVLRDAWEVRRLARRRRRESHTEIEGDGPAAGRITTDALGQDLRWAVRSVRRAPGFSASVVAVLALGIGANASIFTLVDGLLLEPLPYREPDRLVMIWETFSEYPDVDFSTSLQGFADWERALEGRADLAGYTGLNMTLEGGEWPERLDVIDVSPRFFEVLGVDPLLGRWIGPADRDSPESSVVVLGHELWQRRFGGDPQVIGRTLSLGDETHEVVGVMGPDFWYYDPYGLRDADAFTPMRAADFEGFERGDRIVHVIGRLRDGVELGPVQATLDSLGRSIAAGYPETHEGWGIQAVPLHAEVVDDVRDNVLLLLAAVGFVLAVACFNVANLMLARGAGRRRELAVRVALGASRWRLLRLQLIETTLLTLLGGGLGLLAATWASRTLAALSPAELPLTGRIGVDATVVVVVLAGSLILGVVLGLFASWQSLGAGRSRTGAWPPTGGRRSRQGRRGWGGGPGEWEGGAAALREGGRGAIGGRRQGRLRALIVGAEVALSLVLLSGAGLMLNSYARLLAVDPGLEAEGVLTYEAWLWGRYWDPEEGAELTETFFDRLFEGMEGLPGVTAVGGTSHLPFSGWNMTTRFHPAGETPDDVESLPSAGFRRVTPGYFDAVGLDLVRGRDFEPGDRAGGAPVIVVNRAFVDAFLGGEDPLGRELVLIKGTSLPPDPWRIVGVVENVKHADLAEPDRASVYVPHAQDQRPALRIVARTAGDPASLVGPVRRLVREIDPRQPLAGFATLEELVDGSLSVPRFHATVLGLFAAAALLLAGVGIAGVVSYAVHQRVREIGIRVALGAAPSGVVRWIVGGTMLPVGIGLAVGLAGSLAASRALSSLLYEIGPTDPPTLALTVLLLSGVALLACWFPARRAARVDPLEALGAR